MSESNKILSFLIKNDAEISHFEAVKELRVNFKKEGINCHIKLDTIDFDAFYKEFLEVYLWTKISRPLK
jgi:hypothetical protein